MRHLSLTELEAGLDEIRRSPRDEGTVALIVRRPDVGEREVVSEAKLDVDQGLLGDGWYARGNPFRRGEPAQPEMQINIMNARAALLIAGERDRMPLAGDQLYIDLDLSLENLPAGTRLSIGSAVVEVTPPPHRGCKKFEKRFGADAVAFVNSELGKALNLRGINAKVVRSGVVRTGDVARKLRGDTATARGGTGCRMED